MARHASVVCVGAQECSTLSVCVCCGACGDTLQFRAWGVCAFGVPSRSAATATPQPKGSTRTHRRRPHMHPHTTVSVAPLPRILGLHCLAQSSVSPSPWQPPGPGAAKNRKLRGYPPGWKNARSKLLKNTCIKSVYLAGTPQPESATETAHMKSRRANLETVHISLKRPSKTSPITRYRVAPMRKASGARFCTNGHSDTLSHQALHGS